MIRDGSAAPAATDERLDARWLEWINGNLERGCAPDEVLEILIKAGFSLPAIQNAMGAHFPTSVTSTAGGTERSPSVPSASSKTIFVQIASYRDDECQWTLKDLFEKAKYPDRVNVGLCWQFDPYADRDCFTICTRPSQVRMALCHWKESQGVCWARRQAQQLWQGEDYVLMIDSHMRFGQDWDERAIRQLDECPSPKPVLSNYPASYRPPDKIDLRSLPTVMRPTPYTAHGDLRFHGVFLDRFPERPLRGAFIAAGFIFAANNVISEVPYDPYMYFNQEEVSLAVRLFTHGFDVYSPKDILAYHYYHCLQEQKKRPLHWGDNPGWGALQKRAVERWDHLTGYAVSRDADVTRELDTYGLGTSRTLAEYERFCGIDFERRCVSERALRCEFIEDLSKYKKTPMPIQEERTPSAKSAAPPLGSDADVRAVFTRIHNLGGWVYNGPLSGPDRALALTAAIRQELPSVVERYAIRSMLDVGCGEFNWLQEICPRLKRCIGADIVPALVEWNRSNRSGPGREFVVVDVCSDPLPAGIDLVFCRDCLVHLSNDRVLAALKNLVESGAKYLLTTTFPGRGSQPDITNGQWRPLDLQAEPFSLPPPLMFISEQYLGDNRRYSDKSLGLWECSTVKSSAFGLG